MSALAAKAARTNPQYISVLRKIEKEDTTIYAEIKTGKIELPRAKRMLRQAQAEQRLKAAAKLARPEIGRVDLRVGTMEKLLAEVRNLDAIITDPPNEAAAVPLYGEMARLAKKALKPDGIRRDVRAEPPAQIVEDMHRHIVVLMDRGLHDDGRPVRAGLNRKVNTFWKLVVIFGEQPPQGRWLGDVVRSDMSDKLLHEWQQSESGLMRLVERLTVPDALVCDPFLGVGTTAVACVRLHRRIVGCDTDKAAVKKARARAALASATARPTEEPSGDGTRA